MVLVLLIEEPPGAAWLELLEFDVIKMPLRRSDRS
jgi:hypothetical protein